MANFFYALISLSLELAPWLVIGLTMAGILRTLIPMKWVSKVLGGKGILGPFWAATLGTPLPLCSCSVIPVAIGLRRQGASDSSTVSFLVATPQNGPDTFLVTWAMLGPIMAFLRPIVGIISGVLVALPVSLVATKPLFTDDAEAQAKADAGRESQKSDCCPSQAKAEPISCCGSKPEPKLKSDCCSSQPKEDKPSLFRRLAGDVYYAYTQILSDIAIWLIIGLLIAAAVKAAISPELLAGWGAHPLMMFIMLIVGIPMYICSTYSTPIAAALYMAGVSPGAIIVFLLAGPATNSSTFGILYKEMGIRAAVVFAVCMMFISMAIGFIVDIIFTNWQIKLYPQHLHEHEMVQWLSYASLAMLIAFVIFNIYRKFGRVITKEDAPKSCCSK